MAQAVSRRRPAFKHGLIHVAFVVSKVALGQDFSEFFGFLCQYHYTVPLHTDIASGGLTIGSSEATVERHGLPRHEQQQQPPPPPLYTIFSTNNVTKFLTPPYGISDWDLCQIAFKAYVIG
jgi:hypothetical protein